MILRLAYRNIWRNKRRTLITVLSISGGMMFSMLFTGLQDGNYTKFIDVAARTGSGHLTLEHPDYREDRDVKNNISDYRKLLPMLKSTSMVEDFAFRIAGQGMLASSYNASGVTFNGVVASQEKSMSPLAKEIVRGSYLQDEQSRGVIIGDGLAKKLRVDLGNKLVLTVNNKANETVQELLRVVGIFHVGAEIIDSFYLQMPLKRAQSLLGYDAYEVTQIPIFLKSHLDVETARRLLQDKLSAERHSTALLTWREVMQDIANYIAMDRAWNYVLQILAFLIIAAGILNTVLMSVLERKFEFGVMLAIGSSPRRLFSLILGETSFIGLLGVAGGSLLGWGVNLIFKRYPIDLRFLTKEEISISGYAFEPMLQTGIYFHHYVTTTLLIYLLVLLVGIYPAFKAMRITPVEALHGT